MLGTRTFAAAAPILAVSAVVGAQDTLSPLFYEISGVTPTPAISTTGVLSRAMVGMRLERLFDPLSGAVDTVVLNIDDRALRARFEREDLDPSGFRSWVGSLEGVPYSHVVFTVRDGVVSGLINAVSVLYQVRTASAAVYVVDQLDPAQFRRELNPPVGADGPVRPAIGSASLEDGSAIDVLLLYTDAARVRAGGSAQIEALVSQVVSDTNTAFARSGVVPRLRLAGSAPLPFAEAPSLETDLLRLTSSSVAQGLRNDFRADLVQLLVSSPDFSACGIGWLLAAPSANFDAYSVADVSCVAQYTPTHEMGHNMGSHHAPEDGATGAALPFSYAYKDPVRGFRTIMAHPCAGASCPRIPNFSNPSVLHDGYVTGSSGQNNAGSLNIAASTVANWRDAFAATPPPPTGLVTQVLGTLVTAAWEPVHASASVTNYILQVGTTPGASDLIDEPIGNVTSISGHAPRGIFYWRVLAVNEAGASRPSPEAHFTVGGACTPPGSPQGLTIWLDGRTVNFKWVAPASGSAVTNYVLEVGSLPGLADTHRATTGPATHLSAQAPPGIYFTRLRAQNECGISEPTREQLVVVR